MTSTRSLRSALAARRLVLDGAMGTALLGGPREHDHEAARPVRPGDADRLTLEAPARVAQVHAAHLAAGADIVRTNTFCAGAVGAACAVDPGELTAAAARLARDAANAWSTRTPAQPRFVAGVLGPWRPSDGGATEAAASYRAQTAGLLHGGVDVLLVETAVDARLTAVALAAAADVCRALGRTLDVLISAADVGDRHGIDVLDAVVACGNRADGVGLLGVGINCGSGPGAIPPALLALARTHGLHVTCHPSAGLPDAGGRYAIGPADFAATVSAIADAASCAVVGGCCGTTPAHTAALARVVPRPTPGRGPER